MDRTDSLLETRASVLAALKATQDEDTTEKTRLLADLAQLNGMLAQPD